MGSHYPRHGGNGFLPVGNLDEQTPAPTNTGQRCSRRRISRSTYRGFYVRVNRHPQRLEVIKELLVAAYVSEHFAAISRVVITAEE